jgi:GntR family transcriptional regulator / MocR family aminotransferase
MLTYDMTRHGKTPLYQYLYQKIRDDILSGRISPNEKLPSKRALAKHLDLSVITVENAYELLLIEGYIYAREKVGYFAETLSQRPKTLPPRHSFISEPREHQYFADLSSNKVDTSLFPISSLRKLSREALSRDDPFFLETVPYNGLAIFRYAIANFLGQYRGMRVDPEQIIIGCGTEYLYSRLMQCFSKNTVLGLEDPGNHKFSKIADRYNLKTEYLPVDDYGPSSDALAKSHVNLLHLSPANAFPIGLVMPIKRRLEVLTWLYQDEERYLIEDDFDSEFTSYGTIADPVFNNDYKEKTIYINSFSKTMLPSLRVSYMILPHKLLHRYHETLSFYSCTVSATDQYIYARFIEDGYFERHLNHMNTHFKNLQAQILQEMEAANLDQYCDVITPRTGTALLLRLHVKTSIEQLKLFAQQFDIRIAFVSDYAVEPTEEEKHVMIFNYASLPPERVHSVISMLKLILSME